MWVRYDWLSISVICSLQFTCNIASFLYTKLFKSNKQHALPAITNTILLKRATELTEMVRRKDIQPSEILQAYFGRIFEVNETLNAVVEFNENTMERAKELEQVTPSKVQTLFGVPFSSKDSIWVDGVKVTWGHPAKADKRANKNEKVVQNLLAAGAIHTCVTNISELSMYYDSYNKLYGSTNNPYDTSRISGGSSGGEAALIAAGGSLMGIATDLAGSIRIPSFFCGIYGLKPTSGVVPKFEHVQTTSRFNNDMLVIGPMCRYVDDIIPMLKAMAGENISKLPLIDQQVDIKNITVYYMLGHKDPLQTTLKLECRIPVEKAVNHLESIGLKCVKVHFVEFNNSFNIWLRTFVDNYPHPFTDVLRKYAPRARLWCELFKACFGMSNFRSGTLLLSVLVKWELRRRTPKYVETVKQELSKLKEKFNSTIGKNGVFLYPSHPELAPKHQRVCLKFFNTAYTGIFNALNVPVMQCPLGLSKEGLPTGLQIAAQPYNEHLTVAIAKELDKKFGGWTPPS